MVGMISRSGIRTYSILGIRPISTSPFESWSAQRAGEEGITSNVSWKGPWRNAHPRGAEFK